MSLTLDTSKGDNTVTLHTGLPINTVADNVELEFVSDYDGRATIRSLDVAKRGPWITGTLASDRIPPYSGRYSLKIFDTEGDFPTILEITQPITTIASPWSTFFTNVRAEQIGNLAALIIGADNPTSVIHQVPTSIVEYPSEITEVVQRMYEPTITERITEIEPIIEYNSGNDAGIATTYHEE